MSVLALDWNATRVSAVLGEGEADGDALPMALEPPSIDLPMAIALGKTPEVGVAALRRSRVDGHLVCHSFLPYLTEKPGQGPNWQAGAHRLDAHAACQLVWRKLHALAADASSIVLTVPDYLRPIQVESLRNLGEKLRLPIVGTVPNSLAAALSSYGDRSWQRTVLIVDVDEHALTLGWVKAIGDSAHLVESRSFTHLGLRVWRERMIDALSDLFVLEHRRDPRDAAQTEQSLFDQLDILTDAALENRAVQLAVQGRAWFKHLLVQPDQSAHFCTALASKASAQAEHLLLAMPGAEGPPTVLLTHAAGRLPGLIRALQALPLVHPSAETKLPQLKATAFDDADFGDSLLIHANAPALDVRVLRPEAPAQAAHGLAEAFAGGALQRGHLDLIVPLPATAPPSRPPLRAAANQ